MEEISQCDMSLFQQNECMRFSGLMTLWHRINQNDNCNKIHTRQEKNKSIFVSELTESAVMVAQQVFIVLNVYITFFSMQNIKLIESR